MIFVWWAASSENLSSNMRIIRRSRSSCACAKSHPGLYSPFIYFEVSNDSVSGQWWPWSRWHIFAWRAAHFWVPLDSSANLILFENRISVNCGLGWGLSSVTRFTLLHSRLGPNKQKQNKTKKKIFVLRVTLTYLILMVKPCICFMLSWKRKKEKNTGIKMVCATISMQNMWASTCID